MPHNARWSADTNRVPINEQCSLAVVNAYIGTWGGGTAWQDRSMTDASGCFPLARSTTREPCVAWSKSARYTQLLAEGTGLPNTENTAEDIRGRNGRWVLKRVIPEEHNRSCVDACYVTQQDVGSLRRRERFQPR